MRGLFRFIILGVTVLTAAALPAARSQAAGAQAAMQAGMLSCSVASGWGYVLVSWRDLKCVYSPSSRPPEHYTGKISKYGVDIGYVESSMIVWAVIATSDLKPGSLGGTYVGVTGSATVGVGVGANALIGGSGNTIALQPLSLEGSTGLNVAAGIGAITLTPAR
jgi:uncharacterized protein DUF992